MQSATFLRLFALLLVSGVAVSAQNSVKRKSPTSKFYVADVNGFSQVNTGEKIEDLTEKSVFDADGTIIETKPESDNAIVMSNGVGIYFKEDTKLAVKRFIQEPFQPNRTDIESEPSVSQTRNMLARGSVGLCSGKLVAGSSMVYDTPHGSINVLSQNVQKMAVEIGDEETVVTLFEGALTLRGDNMAGGEALQPGQQAVIRNRGVGQPPEIRIAEIPADRRDSLEDMVNGACQARRQVYFDTANPIFGTDMQEQDTEIVVIPVNPTSPTESGPVVSPARPVSPSGTN